MDDIASRKVFRIFEKLRVRRLVNAYGFTLRSASECITQGRVPASGAEICRFDLDPAQRKIEIGEPGVECTVEYRGHKREKERYKLSLIREEMLRVSGGDTTERKREREKYYLLVA